jgi:germination protein M
VIRGRWPAFRPVVILLTISAAALTACRKEMPASNANLNAANKVSVRPVRLYFESPRMLLAAETRSMALPESPAAAIPALVRELMKGPAKGSPLGRLFPEDTVVRGAYLLPGGTVIVDLGGTTLTQGWGTGSHQELMSLYSLAQSLSANFADARRVRVLINGTPTETLAGHVALTRSIGPPQAGLLDPSSR